MDRNNTDSRDNRDNRDRDNRDNRNNSENSYNDNRSSIKKSNANDCEAAPPQYTEQDAVNNRSNLPSYDASSTPQEPPPSYDSIYGRIKAAKNESSGFLSFLKAFLVIILSTICFTILIAIFMAIPLAMLIMGAVHLDNCSAERMIPIYLIVAGCFGVAKNLYSLIQRCRMNEQEREEDQKKINPYETLVHCFLFAWFIAGCVFIYRTRGHFQHVDKSLPDYCDYALYWFAFWITTAVFIIMALSCCFVCFVGCLSACFGKSE